MARIKQPRHLNPVSLLVYLVLAAIVYGGVKFGPPYWRSLKVDEAVRGAVNEYWAATRGSSDFEAPPRVRESLERAIRDIGVDDPDLQLTFERDGEDLRVTATYKEVVTHPFVNRTTTLHFAPTASTPIVDKRK